MKRQSFCLLFAATVVCFSLVPALAQAYIDPGNGAYMVQLLFTLMGAALFYVRHPIRGLRALASFILGRRKSGETEPDALEPTTHHASSGDEAFDHPADTKKIVQ